MESLWAIYATEGQLAQWQPHGAHAAAQLAFHFVLDLFDTSPVISPMAGAP
jgi:hypothetical protein